MNNKLQSPDNTIKKIYNHMSQQSWYAFVFALIAGFLTHIFILTNELFNHDDIAAWMDPPSKPGATRWLQGITTYLVSPLGSGVMAGSLTIIVLAITALLIVDTLKVKSKIFSIIIGIMMLASPIVASFMSYPNGSYQFTVGIPFAVLAVRWYEKGWKGYIAAALSLMCAIAGYQSNIAITIALLYIVLFGRLFEKDVKIKKWWISFGKAFLLLLLGLILYILSSKVVTMINGDGGLSGKNGYSVGITTEELTARGYEGQAEAGTLYVSQIPNTVKIAITYFIKYNFNIFFGGANISFASKINVLSSIIILILVGITLLTALIKQQGIVKKLMICIVAVMAPICINSVEIILNGKCDETLQMMYSMIMLVPLVITILEKGFYDEWQNIILNIAVIAFILHIYGNVQIVNDAYQRMNSIYESAYGEMCRIIARIELLPEWQDRNRIVYFDYDEYPGTYLINENYHSFASMYEPYIDMGWLGVFGSQVHNFWGNENTSKFVKCYFGLEFNSPTEQQIEIIKASVEYKELKQFPSVDSIKVIEDVVVVRMDDAGQE